MEQPITQILLLSDETTHRAAIRQALSLVSHIKIIAYPSSIIYTPDFEEVFESIALVLLDCSGKKDPFDVFAECSGLVKDVPMAVCLDVIDHDFAMKCIQAGAQDCVWLTESRDGVMHLENRIMFAIERQSLLLGFKFALASEKVLMEELDRKNKELVELSITDGLTGLYNHRFIQERFDFEFKRAKRYGSQLSCLLIDIDHFKRVNDTFGHQFGDHVLMEIGTILKVKSRDVDICGRYGGEEFMIIVSLGAEETLKFATKLNDYVDKYPFSFNGQSVHVTISIGVAEYCGDVKTRQELIERSDTAMYWAKRDGRNMIRLWKEMSPEDATDIDHFSVDGLKTEFMRLSNEVRATYMESTNALVRAIDAKDHYTQEHSNNVAGYAVAVAKELALSDREIEIIKYAGLLHDIGKIGIAQDILIKKELLTNEEFEILKKHPVIGANILRDVKFLEKEVPIILHHHERFDGKGYPYGLKGREIPLGARILGVVDAFDAMTTDRGYRKKLTQEAALEELQRSSGTQLEPEIVDIFVNLLAKMSAAIVS